MWVSGKETLSRVSTAPPPRASVNSLHSVPLHVGFVYGPGNEAHPVQNETHSRDFLSASRKPWEWSAVELFSQKVSIKPFCKSQLPHKFVSLSFIITNMKNKLTSLCGNRLWQSDFINTFCEMKTRREHLNTLKIAKATTEIRLWLSCCGPNRSTANRRNTQKHGTVYTKRARSCKPRNLERGLITWT